MTPFQWLTVPILALAAVRDAVMALRTPGYRVFFAIRAFIWALAAAAIADPDVLQNIALGLSIGRGADLVSYLFVLAFLVGAFVVYGRFQRMQRQITELTRTIAIMQARRPDEVKG
jgi:small membrane protein